MVHKQLDSGWLLRLEKGEELIASLLAFCGEQNIQSGWINGLGGVMTARVGYYNLNRQKYIFRAVKDARELVSLQGNISRIDTQVALHLHGVVSDSNGRTRAGHIKELIVGGTVEIYIQNFATDIQRQIDSDIGLPLLQL